MGNIYIGISGWRYPPWRGVFYPKHLKQKQELEFAARALPSIEINVLFYSLQRPESYAAWYAATPPGFVFSVKGNRYITHIFRVRDIEKPLANVFASAHDRRRARLRPPTRAAHARTQSAGDRQEPPHAAFNRNSQRQFYR